MIGSDTQTAVEHLEDLSCEYHGHRRHRRMLNKQIIYTRKGWALVAFHYQDYKRASDTYDEPVTMLARYVKRRGKWRKQSSINLRQGRATEALAVVAGWEASYSALRAVGIDLGAAITSAREGLGAP